MDNNNLFNQGNSNGEQGQYQQQPYQQPYQQQPYQQPYQQQYQQPYQSGDNEVEEPVSFADWMVTMLIMCIPCLNIIMMFVWAFGSGTKKSKANYFRAMLVWTLISIVLVVLLVIIYGAVFASLVGGSASYY